MNRLTCLAGLVLLCSLASSAQAQVAGGFIAGPGFVAGRIRSPAVGYPTYTSVAPAPYVVHSQYVTSTPVVTQSQYVAPAPVVTTTTVPAYGIVGQRSTFVGPLGGQMTVDQWNGPLGTVGVVRGIGPFGGRGIAVFSR